MKLDRSLKSLNFTKCDCEPAVYTRGSGKTALILGVYVDDLLVTGGDLVEIMKFKKEMTTQFEMSDLGLLSFYLGIKVDQREDFIAIKQTSYANKVMKQFGMGDYNPTAVQWIQGLDFTKIREENQLMPLNTEKWLGVLGTCCTQNLI